MSALFDIVHEVVLVAVAVEVQVLERIFGLGRGGLEVAEEAFEGNCTTRGQTPDALDLLASTSLAYLAALCSLRAVCGREAPLGGQLRSSMLNALAQ